MKHEASRGGRWVGGTRRPAQAALGSALTLWLAALGMSACGSDAPLSVGKASGEHPAQTQEDEPAAVAPGETPSVAAGTGADGAQQPATEDPFAVAGSAPGYQPYSYPQGPYGIAQGAIIENLEFHGWASPTSSSYDLTQAGTIRLSDFYDPTGEKGTELLLINSVAVWCGVCRTEYADLQTNETYTQLSARGLQMLGLLFEDNDGAPARYVDMVNWGSAFGVQFPFGLDPGFKTGVYFDRSATPMNMLVDARTMQILLLMTGYSPELYQAASDILTERGR